MKIGVIGAGIAGLGAAWLLSKKHKVTLFEANSYLGGHANTVDLKISNSSVAVDLGFVVYNEKNYPNFSKLLSYLEVHTKKTSMSFSFSNPSQNIEYSSTLPWGPFVQPFNIFNKEYLYFLFEVKKFYQYAKSIMKSNLSDAVTIEDVLTKGNFSKFYTFNHLLPMASSIWSLPINDILAFQAGSFLKFYQDHGLLQFFRRPQWRMISNGSRNYVSNLLKQFSGKVRLSESVIEIKRKNNLIIVHTNTSKNYFDHVVLALHPNDILKIISDISEEEKRVISLFEYKKNSAYVHTDPKFMPKRKRAWSSWNYNSGYDNDIYKDVPVTYWVNLLQKINCRENIFITLNPNQKIYKDYIIYETSYEHPVFNTKTVQARKHIESIQGTKNTWFCGAWMGFGFHEDGLVSGLNVAKKFGCYPPWNFGK